MGGKIDQRTRLCTRFVFFGGGGGGVEKRHNHPSSGFFT